MAAGVKLNFKDADLKSIFKFMSELTGVTYVYDDSIKGNATIVSSKEVTVSEACSSLESLLMAKGISLIKKGNIIQVVYNDKSGLAGIGDVVKGKIPSEFTTQASIITHVIELENVSSGSLKKIIQPLVSKHGNIMDFTKANKLVITDISANINRMLKIINLIDSKKSSINLKSYSLKYCNAAKTAAQLSLAINRNSSNENAQGIVFPIEDKNMIAVAADKKNIKIIENLLEKIDNENSSSKGHIKIIQLKFADAQKVASTIEKMFISSKGLIAADTQVARYTSINFDKRLKLIILTSPSPKIIGRIEGVIKSLDVEKKADDYQVKVIRLKHASSDKMLSILRDTFVGQDDTQSVNIVSDPSTNSLVVTASRDKYQEIFDTVQKLDTYRKQVLVEALIAEVSLSAMKEIGMELGISDNSLGTNNALVGTNFGIKQSLTSSSGLNAGVVKGSIDIDEAGAGDLSELSKIRAIIKAYQNNSKFKILSTPTILCSDNEPSSIIVGQVVALPEGFARDTETGRFDLTKFKYADVGIDLNIIPRVSPDRKVTLSVKVKAQERLEENLYDFNIPVLTKRAAETTITISDRETVVIGGLIREDRQKQIRKVPVLGDLPLIGKFFRSKKTIKNKTNLLIFITPHVIDRSDEMKEISNEIANKSELSEDTDEFTNRLKKRAKNKTKKEL